MSDQQRSSSPLTQHLPLAAIALVASIVILVGGYVALAARGGWFADTQAKKLNLDEAAVIVGESKRRGALWAPTADARGILIVRLSDRTVDTALFPTLRLAALADTQPMDAKILWRRVDGPMTTFVKTFPWRGDGVERVVLATDPEWHGGVAGLALALRMQPRAGLLLGSATLLPETGRSILSQLAGEWLDVEPWGEYSVNYLFGGAPNPRVPMLLATFAVFALAFGVYAWLARREGLSPSVWVGVAFAVAAWIAVDARWQFNLLSNLRATAQKYAGKTMDEKHRAAEDSKIYLVAEAIRRGLPEGVTKVTLVSDLGDTELFVGKLRYYLFPLYLQAKPDPLDARAVLAIVEAKDAMLDPQTGKLRLAEGRLLDVDTLVDDPLVRLVRTR